MIRKILTLILFAAAVSCNNGGNENNTAKTTTGSGITKLSGHYEGSFTNGMKETFISFDVSEDETKLENLTFKGYWRCDGTLEQTTLGPEKAFDITGGRVDGVIAEPEDGGASAIRFQLKAEFKDGKAAGDFRMNINALACDTYLLNWTAVKN